MLSSCFMSCNSVVNCRFQWTIYLCQLFLAFGLFCRMFYFFFESRNRKEDPVVIWLTGGPGCSSELALFYENGPFKITDDLSLVWNEYGWDKVFDIHFINVICACVYANLKSNFEWFHIASWGTAAHTLGSIAWAISSKPSYWSMLTWQNLKSWVIRIKKRFFYLENYSKPNNTLINVSLIKFFN